MARKPGDKAIGLSFLMKFRVPITGAGTTTAVSAFKYFGLPVMPQSILSWTMSPDSAGAHLSDELALMPSAETPDLVERVIELCRDLRNDLVIPIIDHRFMGWAQAAGRLAEDGTRVAVSPVPTIGTNGRRTGLSGTSAPLVFLSLTRHRAAHWFPWSFHKWVHRLTSERIRRMGFGSPRTSIWVAM